MANPETAVFPGAVASDTVLPPWTDGFSTLLTAPIDSDDLLILVASTNPGGDSLNTPCILSIDNEQILIDSASGNALTVNASGRGFGGTTATSHTAGSAVKANLTAYHINQAFAELKKVQNELLNNVANIGKRYSFLTSGNFIVPTGITELKITAWGGGGGGGGGSSTPNGGGGGGAGQMLEAWYSGLTSGGTITIAYGAGGAGGSVGADGTNGGTTQLSGGGLAATINANGGKGGKTLGGGGESGAPSVNADGSPGGSVGGTRPELRDTSGGGGGGANVAAVNSVLGAGPNQGAVISVGAGIYVGGHGGGCAMGYAGAPTTTTGGAAGGVGAGGAGGSYNGATRYAGGAGAAGGVLIEW